MGLKPQLQSALRSLGVYERLKASALYDLYWSVADRSLLDSRRSEREFYHSLLKGFRKGDVIFDIGANQGAKASIFLSLGATVVAVEPDQLNQQILARTFHRHRLHPKPVIIVGKALGEADGQQTMWIDHAGSAKNTISTKWVEVLRSDADRFGQTFSFSRKITVEATTLDSLIELYGLPAFIKIDVEGHELNVLRGLRRPVPCLSFEVNLPEFREEGLLCVKRLASLDTNGLFNFVVDCQSGLELPNWLDHVNFTTVLDGCSHPSIEVIWRSSTVASMGTGDQAGLG